VNCCTTKASKPVLRPQCEGRKSAGPCLIGEAPAVGANGDLSCAESGLNLQVMWGNWCWSSSFAHVLGFKRYALTPNLLCNPTQILRAVHHLH